MLDFVVNLPVGTVVEDSTPNPEAGGLNPTTTSIGKEKMPKNKY
jgi:hypothetical protein